MATAELNGRRLVFFPLALRCYRLGRLNVTEANLSERLDLACGG